MIQIYRGLADADGAENLRALETTALTEMRRIRATHSRDPTQEEIERFDYRIAGMLLWKRQHRLCAYCEHPEQRKRNDVDHFRPKTRANRGPAHAASHGYWWLAWRWDNLLFACRNCNQSLPDKRGKLDNFPLDATSGVLQPEDDPYGSGAAIEQALFIDPSLESGIEHIEFKRARLRGGVDRWMPFPRKGSVRGAKTIDLLGLDREELIVDYDAHVEDMVKPEADRYGALHPLTADEERERMWREVEHKLLRKGAPFAGLSYDALRVFVPDEDLPPRVTRRTPPL